MTEGPVLLGCDATSLDFRHLGTTEWSHFEESKCPRRMNIAQGRGVSSMQCPCTMLSSVACLVIHYFSTLFHKRHDFRKRKFPVHEMYVLIFSTTFAWNISPSKKWGRYDEICILVFKWSTHYSCDILMKLEFSRQIFEKYSNTKFREYSSSGSRVVPCGRTDGQTRRS